MGVGGAAQAANAEGARLAGRRGAWRHRAGRLDRQRRVPARSGGVRAIRPVAALGDRGRRLPPDDLQHRADALHGRHRGAGVHRLHAHAPLVDALGLGVRRPLLSCRSAGRRGPARRPARFSFSLRDGLRGPSDATRDLLHRRGDVPHLCGRAARSDGASSARSSCSTGCWSCRILGGFLVLAVVFVPGSTWLAAAAGLAGFDAPARRVRLFSGRHRLLPARRAGRVLGRRRRRQPHAVELGARQGLRDGRASRLHPGGRRRAQGASRAQRLHVRARRRSHASMARLVAHRPRRSVGRVLHRRDPRHGAAGAALRRRSCRAAPTSRPRHQRRARVRCRRESGCDCSPASIAFLGAWILFKTQLDNLEGDGARNHRHSLDRQPSRPRPGAAATSAPSTTACSAWSWSGASSRCGWRSRSCCCKLGGERGRRRLHHRLAAPALREHAPAAARMSVRRCGGALRSW